MTAFDPKDLKKPVLSHFCVYVTAIGLRMNTFEDFMGATGKVSTGNERTDELLTHLRSYGNEIHEQLQARSKHMSAEQIEEAMNLSALQVGFHDHIMGAVDELEHLGLVIAGANLNPSNPMLGIAVLREADLPFAVLLAKKGMPWARIDILFGMDVDRSVAESHDAKKLSEYISRNPEKFKVVPVFATQDRECDKFDVLKVLNGMDLAGATEKGRAIIGTDQVIEVNQMSGAMKFSKLEDLIARELEKTMTGRTGEDEKPSKKVVH